MAWKKRIQEGCCTIAVCDSQRSDHINSANGILHYLLQRGHSNIQRNADAWLRDTVHFIARVLSDLGLGSVKVAHTDVSESVHIPEEEQVAEHKDLPDLAVDVDISGSADHGAGNKSF